MNIALTGTKITQDTKFLAFEKNNSVDVINVIVDTDESWTYKLDVRYPDKCCTAEPLYNIINLIRIGNLCTVILTSDMLPFTGKYTMQLRGINGDKVSHSDIFDTWVKYSIEPGSTYNPVPSEFYQIESNVTEMNNNPPYPSDDGYWMIWDVESHAYKKSDIKAVDGLPEINESTNGQYLTNNGDKAYWAEVQAGEENKIDKIEVNGAEQPIVDKTVNIAVPIKTSDLSNDSGYITANDVPVKSVDGATGDVVTNAVKTTAQSLTNTQKAQARTNIGAGTSSFDGDYNSLSNKPTIPEEYTLPVATSTELGGVMPVAKTTAMTQAVGVDDNGRLYTSPGGGTGTGAVTSVNGKTGDVELSATDVGALPAPSTMTANRWFKTDASGNVALSALPNASTGSQGITYLVNSYTRTDTDKAVVPKALNDVYNLMPKPDAKTATQTQAVGMDSNGKLWTVPGDGGGGSTVFMFDAHIDYGAYDDEPIVTATYDEVAAAVLAGNTVIARTYSKTSGYPTYILPLTAIRDNDYYLFSAIVNESPDTAEEVNIVSLKIVTGDANESVWSYTTISNIEIVNITGSSTLTASATAAQIYDWINAGKMVYAKGSIGFVPCVQSISYMAIFARIMQNGLIQYYIINDTAGTVTLSAANTELTSHKTTSISSESTDTQYPSAKAVYDYTRSASGGSAEFTVILEQFFDDATAVSIDDDGSYNEVIIELICPSGTSAMFSKWTTVLGVGNKLNNVAIANASGNNRGFWLHVTRCINADGIACIQGLYMAATMTNAATINAKFAFNTSTAKMIISPTATDAMTAGKLFRSGIAIPAGSAIRISAR